MTWHKSSGDDDSDLREDHVNTSIYKEQKSTFIRLSLLRRDIRRQHWQCLAVVLGIRLSNKSLQLIPPVDGHTKYGRMAVLGQSHYPASSKSHVLWMRCVTWRLVPSLAHVQIQRLLATSEWFGQMFLKHQQPPPPSHSSRS